MMEDDVAGGNRTRDIQAGTQAPARARPVHRLQRTAPIKAADADFSSLLINLLPS
jgi:hypothetical protein